MVTNSEVKLRNPVEGSTEANAKKAMHVGTNINAQYRNAASSDMGHISVECIIRMSQALLLLHLSPLDQQIIKPINNVAVNNLIGRTIILFLMVSCMILNS